MKLWYKGMLYTLSLFYGLFSCSALDSTVVIKESPLGKTTEYLSIAQSIASISLAGVTAYYVYRAYSKDAKTVQPSQYVTNAGLKSWAGEVPQEIKRVIEYIKTPEIRKRYDAFNVRPYKGILFHGPPGTGKTALARAIAGETRVPFFTPKPADILSRWIGESESRCAQIFKEAREAAHKDPSKIAILFFDEFDAIARKRDSVHYSSLHQLLIELDGFDRNTGIIVIAATNQLDMLDQAVIREGRFDSKIEIGYPDVAKQREILSLCLAQTKYEHNGDEKRKQEAIEEVLTQLKRRGVAVTAAMIAALVDNAARRAAHENMAHITDKLLSEEAESMSKQKRV